jgi:hypothetical protein
LATHRNARDDSFLSSLFFLYPRLSRVALFPRDGHVKDPDLVSEAGVDLFAGRVEANAVRVRQLVEVIEAPEKMSSRINNSLVSGKPFTQYCLVERSLEAFW